MSDTIDRKRHGIGRVRIDRVRDHTFLKNYLNRAGGVVDLGMNQGDFAKVIQAKYGSSVVGVEANPILAAEVRRIGFACRNAAVSAGDGFLKFRIARNNSEASAIVHHDTPLSHDVVRVPRISLETLFRQTSLGRVDLLKIGVAAGAELDIIETTPGDILQQCWQISVAFHPHQTSATRIADAIATVCRSGFHCIDFSMSNLTDVLFINKDIIRLSAATTSFLTYQKYRAGIIRRLRQSPLARRHGGDDRS